MIIIKIYNPILKINKKSRDPFIVKYKDNYYSCYNGYDTVIIRKFKSIKDIKKAEEKQAIPPKTNNLICWYAPEMHLIDGHWYIYAAPCDADEHYKVKERNPYDEPLHSMQVLRSITDDPFGEYEYAGALGGTEGKWSIDGTILRYNGKLYMALDFNGIYICEMDGPLKFKGEPKLLSKPDYEWEKVMTPINEGPAPLYHNNKIYLAFSASDSHSDGYCIGLLTFNGGNILDKNNWTKHPTPILKSSKTNFGPGHCCFLKIDNKDFIVYHANTEKSSGRNGSYMFAQPFEWENDIPVINEIANEFELFEETLDN